jgi:hypothetical protein
MTNATPQKVCNLTLNSFSGTHRHTLGGRQGPPPIGALLYTCSYKEPGAPAVNHIYYVHLRWGYVFRGMVWVVVLGNTCCSEGG